MKETSTLMKLSMTAALMAGYAICAIAQTTAGATKPITTFKIIEVTNNQEGVDAKGSPNGSGFSEKEQNANMPWYNYKGMANVNEAKQQWIKDNPATYKKMQEPNVPAVGAGNTTGRK